MARNLRRYTNKKYPARPKNTTEIKQAYGDVATMQEFGFNLRKTNKFYVDTVQTEGSEFTVFASYDMLGMVNEKIPPEERRYMIDGTFDVVPIRYFYQLLVIAIEYKKDVSFFLLIFGEFHPNRVAKLVLNGVLICFVFSVSIAGCILQSVS